MPIKVLVVDDSNFFRRQILKLLSDDDDLEVVDTAENGKEAVEKALRLKPDVITMDVEMPVMDGITATREILRHQQIPILIFSSLTTEGAKTTLDAMDAGAVDFIPKRVEDISQKKDEVKEILCKRLKEIGRQGRNNSSRKHPLHESFSHEKVPAGRPSKVAKLSTLFTPPPRTAKFKLLAIGTSTGGPLALQKILKSLPKNFPLPIVLVQHMPATFTSAFAQRLNQICDISIKQASNGDQLEAGHAYLAPGGQQMTVKKLIGGSYQLKVFDGDKSLTYKPSVDVTFTSIVESCPGDALAIVLTGMGADGCEGAKKLKASGSQIWAQDEASSVVWGMPAAVVGAGIAEKVIPLADISNQIIRAV